ncbi:aminofutalosine synthase MqnE [Deferribacter autotrophicus]|uniref:Aminodeoxyfutalosine synthase n=1 Tax=Deferribacter autotrophicus TaxID=500465 RepID=A0A5A8F803_9BACT|nr:aminofutalosine synthase MqnE [Deferribacter autotrophicus]KAA0258412.1 aminofutalosine synthase MqnE [Deferribacter autotrophicus]
MVDVLSNDLIELGKEANRIKEEKWGKKVFFVKNIHLNYTNICLNKCKFCAFAKDEGDDDSYSMDLSEIVKYIGDKGEDAKEIHIVGGLHPHHSFEYYLDMVKAIKENFPEKAVKAFSAVEIDYFSKISDLPVNEVLKRLKKAGLDMMPGGGAEIFASAVRRQICPEKISGERWLEVMEIAHKEGIKSNATMLYGHLESMDDILDHLEKLRDLQDKTGGFVAFIPLSFHPENTFLNHMKPATGVEDLRIIALSRIVLDNIPHIKAYWVMLGEKTAQVALKFGADDLDGTIVKENITHSAGAKSKEGLTLEELVYLIKSANLIPVERDSFYNEIRSY